MSISFSHSIARNHGNERPSRVLFYDVESELIPEAKGKMRFKPFLWTMIYKRYRSDREDGALQYYKGSVIDTFWDIVEEHTYKKAKTYLVSHHLEVDFMPLMGMKQLPARGWVLDKLIAHARVLIMWWKRDSSTLVVMNNGNLFDGSIEQWGNQLGLPKLDMPDTNGTPEEWDTYCMRDTEIMVRMWDSLFMFLDEHDLGNFRLTKAGLALNGYKHRFMPRQIAVHNHIEGTLLERLSYKGGRFEALQIGRYSKDTYYNLDINSMYGSIMRDSLLPYELRGYKELPTMQFFMHKLKNYAVIATVDITPTEPIFPRIENDKIIYKCGNMITTLCTPELKLCIDKGWLNSVSKITWYYDERIFREYANYFLELKNKYDKEGNKAMRQVTKLYLNSLYGKFGQKGYQDVVIGECDPDLFKIEEGYDYDTKQHYELGYYGGKIHETVITDVGFNTLTAIASHITAYGRIRIYNLMKVAGFENVYHVATDSLLVNSEGYRRLHSYINDSLTGYLKLEGTYSSITVKDVNDVIKDDEVKIKGIPRKAKRIDDDTYVVTTWLRFTTLIKQGITDHYYTIDRVKHLSRLRYKAWMIANPSNDVSLVSEVSPPSLAAD